MTAVKQVYSAQSPQSSDLAAVSRSDSRKDSFKDKMKRRVRYLLILVLLYKPLCTEYLARIVLASFRGGAAVISTTYG